MASAVESKLNGGSAAAEQEEDPFLQAMVLSRAIVLPMALLATFELRLFEILAKAGPKAELSSKQIVAELPATNPEAATLLDHMLMLLATYGVFGCSLCVGEDGNPERLYSLTPASQYFVRNSDGASAGDMMVLVTAGRVNMDSWGELKNAILEGGTPFNKANGVNLFEYTRKDPSFSKLFNKAMFSGSNLYLTEITESYKGFEDFKCLVDVGGGQGNLLHAIASKYPSIKGINFDLPHVIQDARPHPQIEHVAGNMFESVPRGDAIMLKWVLPNWNDDDCVKLLKNCYIATPEDGKVLIFDKLLPTSPEKNLDAKYSCALNMLLWVQTPGGRLRTQDELLSLAIGAGFRGIRSVCCVSNLWIIELFK